MKRYLIYLYLAIILALILIPLEKTTFTDINDVYVLEFRVDYLFHIILFLPWVFVCHLSFGRLTTKGKLFVLFAGVLIAAVSELIQLMIIYRTFNVNDLLFNISGILIGAFFWLIISKRNK